MARPKNRRKQVYAKRKAKRTKGKLPEHVFWDEPDEEPRPLTISTQALRRKHKREISRAPTSRRDREIDIVSRNGQPQVRYKIKALEGKSYLESVSSSWLSTIGYLYGANVGTFTTKTGRQYKILDFDFETFEEWYYAHSKGTFFNERIKGKYKIVGTL